MVSDSKLYAGFRQIFRPEPMVHHGVDEDRVAGLPHSSCPLVTFLTYIWQDDTTKGNMIVRAFE